MKTIQIIAGGCFALLLSLSSGKVSAQATDNKPVASESATDSFQMEIYKLRSTINKLTETRTKLQKTLNDTEMPAEARKEIAQSIRELNLQIAEREVEIANLEIDHANTVDNEANGAPHAGTDTSKRVVEFDNGYLKIKLRSMDSLMQSRRKLPAVTTQFLGLELGENFLLEKNSFMLSEANREMELSYPKSINVTLYLVRQGINLIRHKVYTTASLAIDYHDYRFKNDITLKRNEDHVTPVVDSINFTKNKLSAHYLMVPVTLNFETNPSHANKSFKLAVGAYGELLVKSYTKQVSSEQGKQHFKDDYNLNRIAYGLIGQVGYGSLQFYTHYSLAPLFEKGKAPGGDMMPLTFGIVLNGFKWSS